MSCGVAQLFWVFHSQAKHQSVKLLKTQFSIAEPRSTFSGKEVLNKLGTNEKPMKLDRRKENYEL